MGFIGGRLGHQVLRRIAPPADYLGASGDPGPTGSLEQLFGPAILAGFRNKKVIDFGCGAGHQSVEMARAGAAQVIGVDIQVPLLERARQNALAAGVSDRCLFTSSTEDLVDLIVSKDAFEHFADPAQVLTDMAARLAHGGSVFAAFGPTWLHPYGGHLFSVFPWSHLVFSESAQIRWRSEFKSDGATRFCEVAGGLNQMTIARFERIVNDSPLAIDWLETVPIKGLRVLKSRLLREIGSSIVRCKLQLRRQ